MIYAITFVYRSNVCSPYFQKVPDAICKPIIICNHSHNLKLVYYKRVVFAKVVWISYNILAWPFLLRVLRFLCRDTSLLMHLLEWVLSQRMKIIYLQIGTTINKTLVPFSKLLLYNNIWALISIIFVYFKGYTTDIWNELILKIKARHYLNKNKSHVMCYYEPSTWYKSAVCK